MSNLKQRTMDCSNHIQEVKNRAILMAEYNGQAGPNAVARQPNNQNRHGSSALLNMNGIRYHRHQRSWGDTLSVAKAKNWQSVDANNKINFIK